MRIRRKIKPYNGLKYRDDRLFVCNLTFSEVKDLEVKNSMMKPTKKKSTQWELLIKRKGRRKRRIYGSNKYPENFGDFIKCINTLSNNIIRIND